MTLELSAKFRDSYVLSQFPRAQKVNSGDGMFCPILMMHVVLGYTERPTTSSWMFVNHLLSWAVHLLYTIVTHSWLSTFVLVM
jgi:hypothetical protein